MSTTITVEAGSTAKGWRAAELNDVRNERLSAPGDEERYLAIGCDDAEAAERVFDEPNEAPRAASEVRALCVQQRRRRF